MSVKDVVKIGIAAAFLTSLAVSVGVKSKKKITKCNEECKQTSKKSKKK